MKKLDRTFYARDTLVVAKELLGCHLINKVDGVEIGGRIVEVEGYMGPDDKAAHSHKGRRTERNDVMYGEAGHAYVYVIYGTNNCFNVITEKVNIPRGVLVRALEPTIGLNNMAVNRYNKSYDELTSVELKGLTNGPGKLCKALGITRKENGADLCGDNIYLLAKEDNIDFEIVSTTRVNIDYAEEAKDFPWRFYIKGNKYVSKK